MISYLLGFILVYLYLIIFFYPFVEKDILKEAKRLHLRLLVEHLEHWNRYLVHLIVIFFIWWLVIATMGIFGIKKYSKIYKKGVINAYLG